MASNGAAELARIGARLQAEGDGALRLRTLAAMRTAARPLVPLVRAEALRRLPSSGGLNEVVASAPISVSAVTGAQTAGVRLKSGSKAGRAANNGAVPHPVFGNRNVTWPVTTVPPGWWSDPLNRSGPAVTVLRGPERMTQVSTTNLSVARRTGWIA